MSRFATIALLLLAVANCGTGELSRGRDSVRQGKYRIAIEHYLTFVKEHPKHKRAPEALFEVAGLQHSALSEPENAVVTYQKLVSSYPVNDYTLNAQRRLAEIYKSHFSNYHQAIIEYEKFIHAAPKHEDLPAVMMELAYCYTLVHNFKDAEAEYDSIIKNYPKFKKLDEVHFMKGNNHFISGEYEKAIAVYRQVMNNFTKSPFVAQALFGIATAYEEMEDMGRAKEYYEKALKTYPAPNVVRIRLRGIEEREKRKNGKTIKSAPKDEDDYFS